MVELIPVQHLDVVGAVYRLMTNVYPWLFFPAVRQRRGQIMGENELIRLGRSVLDPGDPDSPEANPALRKLAGAGDLALLREIAGEAEPRQGRVNVLMAVAILSEEPRTALQGYVDEGERAGLGEQPRWLQDAGLNEQPQWLLDEMDE